jgi:hypothetical protein
MKLVYGFVGAFAAMVTAQSTCEVQIFNTGGAVLDLGGASTSQSFGIIYRINGGSWSSVDMSDQTSPCAHTCPSFGAYVLSDIGPSAIGLCTQNNDCVPGSDYQCEVNVGGATLGPFESTSDSSVFGLGSQISTYCGTTFNC